jgi:nucleotide-binding universal stress UspA family protein
VEPLLNESSRKQLARRFVAKWAPSATAWFLLSFSSVETALYAIALANSFGASITFVHVFPRETNREFTTGDIHRQYERGRDIAKERLASFGDKMGQIYPRCETEFRIGETTEEVKLVAFNLKADLIITASYRPGFLGGLFGLEQARRIVTRAPCSVLVVHEMQE